MHEAARHLLVIVCRNPDVGPVKTRLIPALGEDGARTIYRAFLQDLGARFAGCTCDLVWAYTPEGGAPPTALTPGSVLVQEGPDLGHRLLHIFKWAIGIGFAHVLVISSDVPHLPHEVVESAFAALARCDVVLAPSDDGGYHLVGMSAVHDIFTMVPMSTPSVLAETRRAVALRGLSLQLLAGDFDVDLPEDLPRLKARLERDATLCDGHTARFLRSYASESAPTSRVCARATPLWCWTTADAQCDHGMRAFRLNAWCPACVASRLQRIREQAMPEELQSKLTCPVCYCELNTTSRRTGPHVPVGC